jgi:peptide/nickel transport system substrate-binding protein
MLVVLIASLVLTACGGDDATATPEPKATEPAAAEATTAPEATEAPEAVAPGELKDVPRNRTLILMWAGTDGRYVGYDLWNGYAVGANHQDGLGIMYEPLYFYSAFDDKYYPWLAESHEYNDDFTEMTVKLRPGIEWSDGEPFTAEDVAFTWNEMARQSSAIRFGTNIAQFLDVAEVVDDLTVLAKFKVPAPRFMHFNAYKFDIGVYIVPKHIYENYDDWTEFTAFDLEKGWPVTTGPWKVVYASPEQKVIDRRDSWWAVDAGLTKMPEMERIIYLPNAGETQMAQAHITNQIDTSLDLRPRTQMQTVEQNEAIITHTGRDLPLGYVDWWPTSLYVNNTKPPFDNPDVRWAISYYIDREQVIEIGSAGSNSVSRLPIPSYKPLLPYFEAVEDLLEEYDTTEFNPEKGDARMEKAGFTKDDDGMWVDADGARIELPINGWQIMADIGPVIAEQLTRAGFDASYQQPVDWFDQFETAQYIGQLFGHGGSVKDPHATMFLYQGSSMAIPGDHQANFPRWSNDEFDEIADQVYLTPMDDIETLKELWHDAMEIWLPELPDIQVTEWYHRIPMNTTYWTNWPTEDNAYVNGAFWHLTFQLILNNLEAVQ